MAMSKKEREVIQNLIDRLESENAGCGEDVDYATDLYLKTWIAGPLRLLLADAKYTGNKMRRTTNVALIVSRG